MHWDDVLRHLPRTDRDRIDDLPVNTQLRLADMVEAMEPSKPDAGMAEKIAKVIGHVVNAPGETLGMLPANMRLKLVEWAVAPLSERRAVTADYKRHDRAHFMRYLARNFEQQLIATGMTPLGLQAMRAGRNPPPAEAGGIHWTVEHIRPRFLGGTNDFMNLALMPSEDNGFTAELQALQFAGENGSEPKLGIMAEPDPGPREGTFIYWPAPLPPPTPVLAAATMPAHLPAPTGLRTPQP